MQNKKIIYVDMDGVLADYDANLEGRAPDKVCDIPGYFSTLPPMKNAVEAFKWLCGYFEVYILSTPSWDSPSSYTEKRVWVEEVLGIKYVEKKLILSHNKGLLKGDYLIDDRIVNGVAEFKGEHIHFGSDKFPDWISVVAYLSATELL
jgi:5'-nucleotidase